MKGVIDILLKVGQYVYKNSVWLIPAIETVYRTVKRIIKRNKDDRGIKKQDQAGK